MWNVVEKEVRPFTFSRGDGSRTRRPLTDAEVAMCVEQAIITMARTGVGGDVYMAVIALLSDGSKVLTVRSWVHVNYLNSYSLPIPTW